MTPTSASAGRVPPPRALLQVLKQASVAEVVDVSTEKHQLRVDVIGHTVVGGHCAANNRRHNEGGGIVVHSIPTAFHQGTKSGRKHRMNHQVDPKNLRFVSYRQYCASVRT